MQYLSIMLALIAMLIGLNNYASSYPQYTGYSGAPGRQACSISCHHRHAFSPTITLSGFPSSYIPGQQYAIVIAHVGGSSISQFNCSVRVGTGSINAGQLTGGTATAVYNITGETNGLHATVSGINSGNFNWIAPSVGTGTVRLYWAGLQGGLSNGADTQMVLISTENQTGIDDGKSIPQIITLSQNYPNPFNSETIIEYSIENAGNVEFLICNILGQKIYYKIMLINRPGIYKTLWNGKDDKGADVASGIYFYQLVTSKCNQIRRMLLLR